MFYQKQSLIYSEGAISLFNAERKIHLLQTFAACIRVVQFCFPPFSIYPIHYAIRGTDASKSQTVTLQLQLKIVV